MEQIQTHRDLKVFRLSFNIAMNIFEISKQFPKEEKYSLTNKIRRSSRSVCGYIAEAFRKRKYSKAFVAKLSDAEGESAETQVWLKFAFECNYIEYEILNNYYNSYDHIIGMLVIMAQHPEKWAI
jgi:four helix bundle protein